MHAPLLLRRAAGSLFPLVTGLLALACGGETAVPLDPPTGHLANDLDVTLTYGDGSFCGGLLATKMRLVSDLTFQDRLATGWVALSRMEPESINPSPVFMLGSESLVGQVDTGVVSFDPIQFSMAGQLWQLKEFKLRFFEDGKVDGTASGVYGGGEGTCPVSLTATITGGPDATLPGAAIASSSFTARLPFEPIFIAVDEPVRVAGITAEVKAGSTVVPTKIRPLGDKHPGFASALALTLMDADWPAGTPLSVSLGSLTDVAGHARDIQLGTIQVEPAQDAKDNLGFENGLSRWIADPPQGVEIRSSLTTTDENGNETEVLPPEGASFAVVSSRTRLAAFLVPPAGAKRLHLRAAMTAPFSVDTSVQATGLSIELFAGDSRFAAFDGNDLPPFPQSKTQPTWTGWGEITADLPADSASGFWVQVRQTDPQFSLAVLLDALAFE